MQSKNLTLRRARSLALLITAACLGLGAATARAGTESVTFGFQKGNLTTNGVAYGSGANYTNVVDGRITDNTSTSPLSTGPTATIGNQFRSGSPNGQQHVGLFSYDLTELNDFIAANTGPYSSVAIGQVSLTVISAGGVAGGAMSLNLYGTDPFTASGCTWSNYTTDTAWTVPYQNITNNGVAYGYTGGGSALTGQLGGSTPNTTVTTGNPLTWTSSANFINAVSNALTRPDKTLNLTARGSFFNNGDNRLNIITGVTNDVALRPQLQVVVNVTTTAASATWTGASSTSWTTAGNWLANAVPATDAPIIFDNNSTANLSTVLNQDFSVASISVTNPSGSVSIGGANNLTVGAGGIDLSAATQNLTISAPVALGVSQSWNVAGSRTVSLSGLVTGNGNLLTIAGAGKVSLAAANVLPSGASAGNLVVNGTLDLNGTSQAINALTGSGIVDNTGGGASILSVGNNDAGGTFSGTLQNTSGTLALVKVGTGTLALSGANTFSGGYTHNGGGFNSAGASGTNYCFGTGPVVANAGTIYPTAASWTFTNALTLNGATLRQGGGNSRLLTWSGPVSVTASSTLQSDGGTAGLAIRGNVTLISGATLASTVGGTYHTIYGPIGGNGNLTVNSGYLVLDGVNSYSGSTLLGAGVLRLEGNGTLPAGGALTINGTGIFNVRNTNGWVYNGTITGDDTGSISLSTGSDTTLAGSISGVTAINANNTGTDVAISGNISGGTSVNVQSGGGIMRLTGTNTYSGSTTVASTGTLFVNGDNSGANGSVTVNAGGTLAGTGTLGGFTTINGIHAPGTSPGIQTFAAGLSYGAGSTLVMDLWVNTAAPGSRGSSPLGYDGVDVTGGVLYVDPTAQLDIVLDSVTGNVDFNNAFWSSTNDWLVVDLNGATAGDANVFALGNVTLNGSPFNPLIYGNFSLYRAPGATSENALWLKWTPAPPPTWTGASDTLWTTAGNWTPNAPTSGDIVLFNTSSVNNLATVLNQDYNLSSLILTTPSGPVSIGGANSLTLGSGGVDMSTATQNLTITAPVVLGADQSWAVTNTRTLSVNGGISGVATLTLEGAGKVSLGGASSFFGDTTVAAGANLTMGASNVLPNGYGYGNLTNNGTLDLKGTAQLINGLNGSGSVDNTAAGAAVLTVGNGDAASSFSGTLQNTSGTLALAKVGSAALSLSGTNTFSGGFTNNGTGSVNSTSPAGTNYCFGTGPVVANAGTLYLTTASWTFTNALTLNGGTLRQGGGGSKLLTWSGPASVTADSTIQSDGSTTGININGNVTLSSGATLGSTAGGTAHTIYGSIAGNGNLTVNSGTLNLDAPCSYSGTTLISAGVLRPEFGGTIPSGSALTINGGGNFNVRNTNGWVYNGTITGDGTGSINLNGGTTATFAGGISGVTAINVNTAGTDTTISGNISGSANVNVQSAGGILRLTGSNTYSGTTTVQTNGILFVNGNNVGATGNVQVNGGGTLAGAGSIGGAATANGTLSPGSAGNAGVGSVGTLTMASSLDLSGLASGTGKLKFDLGATNASDKITVAGTLAIGASALGFSDFVFTNVGGLQNGTYKLITSGATITDTLDGANLSGSVGAGSGTLQVSGSGTDIELVVSGISSTPAQTVLTNIYDGTSLTLSWPAGQGWRLQQQTNALSKGLSTNWVFVTDSSVSSTNITVDKTRPATFYRLVYP